MRCSMLSQRVSAQPAALGWRARPVQSRRILSVRAMAEELVAPHLARVSAADVARVLKSAPTGTVILDVRELTEVAEGSIKGALNVSASIVRAEDTSAFDAIVKERISGAPQVPVIVHCHFSKFRGPTCAKVLDDRLKALGMSGTEVKVLAGGVAGFMDEFKGDAALVQLPAGGWAPSHT
ncbi:rhodanese domain phosphatase 3 [Tetrabaena socialis]|uniref:Rhodanese domain phosphatase 3 n=1 Tax=Tetrabaena socialis TaxID=47790 RepID=A0A2J8AIL5_9CHLO|nr:rhodanese domain phosphatase 3 [Tetrabaena socialis]|eukprot:PNH12360.1 rhodanese domain phosphatase 3 [Tetrabaena socialis]